MSGFGPEELESFRYPSFDQVMSFRERRSPVYVNGVIYHRQLNIQLCEYSRKFHGYYYWDKRGEGFAGLVRKSTGNYGKIYFDSFHDLGDDYDVVLTKFLKVMEDTERFTFRNSDATNLLEFWCEAFPRELEKFYPGKLSLASRTEYELQDAYKWVIANTVPGIVMEQQTKQNLEAFFADQPDVTVEWAPDSMESTDVDVLIKKNGRIVHWVSVKNQRSFSKSCISKYRLSGKTKPTVYCDIHLNRIFFDQGSNVVRRKVLNLGDDRLTEELERQWDGIVEL